MAILPFQSTRPLRGATCALTRDATSWKNFNPRAPCGARLGGGIRITFSALNFNPRAPCGARLQTMTMTACRLIISTHAPLAGRDVGQTYRIALSTIFQPTRPLRGATFMVGDVFSSMIFQPTRPLRGATNGRVILEKKGEEFQPTRPLRGATWLLVLILCFLLYFNPRAPCGARPGRARWYTIPKSVFQPTRPLRGATISFSVFFDDQALFQPTRPLRGATL